MALILSQAKVGDVINLKENRLLTEFIVIQKGSPSSAYVGLDGMTLLMRKDMPSLIEWDENGSNSFSDSSIFFNLNDPASGYLSMLDESIATRIPYIRIPYRPGNGSNSDVSSGERGLQCKVFLPSVAEYGVTDDQGHSPIEGTVFSYFSDGDKSKIIAAFNGGSSYTQWTRTPYINQGSVVGIWAHTFIRDTLSSDAPTKKMDFVLFLRFPTR